MPSNEARRNLLSNERLDAFWDALWLELWPFLYFVAESRRIACRCLQTKRGAICSRMSVSTPSGTPCGSSYDPSCLRIPWHRSPMPSHEVCRNFLWNDPYRCPHTVVRCLLCFPIVTIDMCVYCWRPSPGRRTHVSNMCMYLIFDGSVLPRRRFPAGDIGSAMYVATSRPILKSVVAVQLSACF